MPKNEYLCDCNIVHHEAVERSLSAMPSDETIRNLSEFYKIMGDATRCRIICAIKENEMCVCDICNVLSMSKSSVSHQLSKMRENGIVKCRREGKEVYYSLDDAHVLDILSTTITHIDHKHKGEANEN